MIFDFLTKLFGSKNDRIIKKMWPFVETINAFEPEMQAKSDAELKAQTARFKERFDRGESLDEMLTEAFATVRETSVRALKMRHFDVQLIGGIVLHQGSIAEMKTGEGKTLVSTLAAYLNAISGKGVHIITVNDYLAQRDTEWMGQIYTFLGLKMGTILHGLDDFERQENYAADITYGTNNEFGFDYLRDNMKFYPDHIVQGDLNFAVVDEVDSILVDEARTPLIISGPAEKSTALYTEANKIIPILKSERDYTIDEKTRTAVLTEEGVAQAEKIMQINNLYDHKNIEILHHINQALKAHTLFKRDVDYIIKNGEVIIVDEFTGRLMPGRRYSEGLHQALEAKEKVKVENENKTLASITFQNYFRMYQKLSGMTGTADTEAAEFKKIYGLEVVIVPTNQKMVRQDYPDSIYKSIKEKFDAVIEEIIECHQKGQPVLVGTISIDVSEDLSKKLNKRKIPHTVLNAKHHAQEAEIISQAGQKNAVTISTNMAGRGTDIVLGAGVPELGGLHVIGTERHESRRIDNQLRGRSGRQGDSGSSRFYLALEDDLLRIFGGERISGMMDRFGMDDGEPIEHNVISKLIENAQTKVEGRNFDIRKHLLEYDDVMNQQREVIYQQRREALVGENVQEAIIDLIAGAAEEIAQAYADDSLLPEEWNLKGLSEAIYNQFNFYQVFDQKTLDGLNQEGLAGLINDEAGRIYQERAVQIGSVNLKELERRVLLQTIDTYWKDHLVNMDHLKEGINLRGYAQQDPLVVYKHEGFAIFVNLISKIKEESLEILFKIRFSDQEEMEAMEKLEDRNDLVFSGTSDEETSKPKPVKRKDKKVGRNAPCPCGSGKKYKKCCG